MHETDEIIGDFVSAKFCNKSFFFVENYKIYFESGFNLLRFVHDSFVI